MKIVSLFKVVAVLMVLTGCNQQTYNSSSGDAELESVTCSGSGAALRWCLAQQVILNQCVNCHTNYHSNYADFSSEDFVDNDLILPGNSDDSTLFQYLINEGGTMPKDGSALNDADYDAILNWIELYTQ
ncbi:cytochrome c [Bacteriovoracaceae bacterium]|nr:cytochrome c [Bacteriovoracaceae bacterium]